MPGPVLPPGGAPVTGPSAPGGTTSFKVADIILQALIELGVHDPGEPLSAAEGAQGLTKFNRFLDARNAAERYIFAKQFFIGTITPNLQPHLIGPSGTANFIMPQRPVKILAANILLNYPGPTTVRVPVKVQDDMWWANNLAPAIASVIPTDLYYEPDWPNGSMFLWVVPTVAYPLELEIWRVLSQLQLADAFSMPPAYMDWIVYELARSLAPSFDADWTPLLEGLRKEAAALVIAPNIGSPRLGTCDAGIPGKRAGNRSNYNYRTKQFN
jgi:hypothetical protein